MALFCGRSGRDAGWESESKTPTSPWLELRRMTVAGNLPPAVPVGQSPRHRPPEDQPGLECARIYNGCSNDTSGDGSTQCPRSCTPLMADGRIVAAKAAFISRQRGICETRPNTKHQCS